MNRVATIDKGSINMKSPPIGSAGLVSLHKLSSIFKDYSDPDYPRSKSPNLCDLPSGGLSAIVIAPLVNK